MLFIFSDVISCLQFGLLRVWDYISGLIGVHNGPYNVTHRVCHAPSGACWVGGGHLQGAGGCLEHQGSVLDDVLG